MVWTSHLPREAASEARADQASEKLRGWFWPVRQWHAHTPLGEFMRYGAASAFAFAGDFATLVLLTEILGVHYLASAAAGFALGIVIVYCLSIRWVFAARRLTSASMEQVIFVLIGIGGLGINHVVMFTLTELALLPYWLSKVGSVALVFLFNFIFRKVLLFTASARAKG